MSSSFRVLQVIDSLAMGGAERIVAMLSEGLARRGVDVRVAPLRSLAGDTLQEPLRRAGVPVVPLDARSFYDVSAWERLRRYLRRESIDLVHTHLVYADVLGRTAAVAAGVPVVSTLHNVPDGFAHQRADRAWLERTTARLLAQKVICVSDRAKVAFERSWRIPNAKLQVVPNAIDLGPWLAVREGPARDQPSEVGSAQRPITVLSVGRLAPQKAYDVLLQAARIVIDARPHVRFVVLGRGEAQSALERLRDELGLGAHVEFAGQRNDVPAWMARCDVFASSSAWEGMPLVLIEAMAAARPVVVTDVGGNREVVGDDDCGIVVPRSDPAALARSIVALVDDPERRQRMGRAARERVRSRFDLDALVDAHLSIYRQILAARPRVLQRSGNASS